MTVLAIDTATQVCSVALVVDGRILGETLIAGSRNHSEKLLRLIDDLLTNSGILREEIDLIGVSSGPGSFTGLRVGISTAQGLAFGLGKPAVGVSTLDVLALQSGPYPGFVCPMIDAGKKQVYTALYKAVAEQTLEKVTETTVVDPADWLADVPEAPVLFVGTGAHRYRDLIETAAKASACLGAAVLDPPRASVLAKIVVARFVDSDCGGTRTLAPFYVRPPDAVVKAGSRINRNHKS